MALTIGGVTAQFKTGWSLPHVSDEVQVRQHTVTFDSSYATGGESIVAADFGLSSIVEIWVTQPAGYFIEYDKDNDKLKVFAGGGGGDPAPGTMTITDDDNAATNGVAVYVHSRESALQGSLWIGHLEFVSPTNTDGTHFPEADNRLAIADDDAAATGGAQLFVAPAGGGLYANVGAGKASVYIPLQNGQLLDVVHDADPATNQSAVPVYFDEDGVAANRLQAVMADDADETVTFYQGGWNQTVAGVGTEIASGTDLSSLSARVMVIGY